MKNRRDLYVVVILIAMMVQVVGCTENIMDYSYLAGPHELLQMSQTTTKSSSSSWAFVLIAGGGSSLNSEDEYIVFYWKHPRTGEYIFAKICSEKVRFVIDPSLEIPTVRFIGSLTWCGPDYVFTEDDFLSTFTEDFPRRVSSTGRSNGFYLPSGLQITRAQITCNPTHLSKPTYNLNKIRGETK